MYSHAEGSRTSAIGYASHAEGSETIASGKRSHAEGKGTKAESDDMHVQGKYNKTTSGMAHVVGWGDQTTPKDIHTLDTKGNAWFAGDVIVGEGKTLIGLEDIPHVKSIPTTLTYGRFLKRDELLYLFLDSYVFISKDNGSTFFEKVKLFSTTDTKELELEEGVTSLTSVANATPYLLSDNRIAVYYRCNNDSDDNRYASIRMRYIDENNNVSDPHIVISSITNYGILKDTAYGGLYEPVVHNGVLYYCNDMHADGSQSIEYLLLRNGGLPYISNWNPEVDVLEYSELYGTAIDGHDSKGKIRRPGMPSIITWMKYNYMVIESNDNINNTNINNINGTNKQTSIELYRCPFESISLIYEYVTTLFQDHNAKESHAPYITHLSDGRIAISFQSNLESISNINSENSNSPVYDKRFYTYISKEYDTNHHFYFPEDRTYIPYNNYEYQSNEAGFYGSIAEIDGNLYSVFTRCKHMGEGNSPLLDTIVVSDKTIPDTILNISNGVGHHSIVEGVTSKANGSSSHAEGSYNTAYARQSHVEGYKTVAGTEEAYEIDNSSDNGTGSGVIACHAEGDNTVASGSKSHAEGSYSRATGRVSHAEGGITEASGYYAHSENYKTRAIGESSHAEGYMSHASGNYSHSENDNTKANGIGSHAEGYATEANAEYSHAEGHSSKAYGRYSYAGGLATISTGAHSHVRGTRNIADTELQSRYLGSLKCSLNNLKTFPLSANETYNTNDVVLYNNIYWRYKLGNDTTTNIIPGEDSTVWADISDYRGKYLEIVGNGVDGSPSNAYTLDWDGNAWFAGDVAVGADSDVLATQNFVNCQISAIPSKQGTVNTALVSNDVENNKAAGSYSYANGYNTEVNGNYSYASGTNNQAVGSCQTVIGAYNEIDTIIQTRSSSTGDFISATYDVSKATTYDPHVTYSSGSIVYYNNTYYIRTKNSGSAGISPTNGFYWISLAERAGKYLFIVGNGKEVKGNITRSNAMTVDWSGNAWFAGNIKIGGTSYSDADSEELATKEYVDDAKDSIKLKDQSTGAIYELCVVDGKLTLKGSND